MPVDQDDHLRATLAAAKGASVDFAFTCLPESTQVPPTPTGNPSGKRQGGRTPDDFSDGADDSFEEQQLSSPPIIILHLGNDPKGGPNKLSTTIRTDSTGAPIDRTTLTMDMLQGAIDCSLPRNVERGSRYIFLCRTDRKGQLFKDMALAQTDADIACGWAECLGTIALRVAIDLRPSADAHASVSKGAGKPWNPHGSMAAVAASSASSGRLNHGDVSIMVKVFWQSKGWSIIGAKQEMAIRFHTHQVMTTPHALAEAENTGGVTFVPTKWFSHDPTVEAQPQLGLPAVPPQAVVPVPPAFPALAAPAQAAAADFTLLLKNAQLSHHEQGLRDAGYAEVADLKEASDEDLQGLHLAKPEIHRLRRHLS